MRKAPTETQFIIITLVLVCLLAVPTGFSLLDAETSLGEVVQARAEKLPLGGQRSPASIPGAAFAVKSDFAAMIGVDLNCQARPHQQFKVTGRFLQLSGKSCFKNLNLEKIEIMNKNNGYTASLFLLGQGRYQTDMIQLVDGVNEIKIHYQVPQGQGFEQTIQVQTSGI